uniref:GDNF family receptor alpha-like n=1 Tax=Semicossyphus pulcher TaxID=241346 RepID=UPI0037E88BB2
MHLTRLETGVIFGIVFPHIFSLSMSPPPPADCSAAVYTCMSDLCKKEQAFYADTCDDEACQIKGSELCNMTIHTVLDQYPSLQGCVCVWEEELCDSIRALAAQCRPNTAAQQTRSSVTDWQSSSLIGQVYDGAGSCLDRMKTCVSDAVCNRYLAPVLQACTAEQCDHGRCQQVTQQFYSGMPHSVAETLVLCECEASDQSCMHMKAALHSGTCGDSTWVCQETATQCVEDQNCRNLLKTFRAKCWSSEECSDTDLRDDECLTWMDSSLMLGADSECKAAFLATLGTVLHYPCTCKGMHSDDLQTCNMIHDALHNRSRFMTSWQSSSGPSKPPEVNESEEGHRWSQDFLLYAFATVLLVGVVLLMPLAVVCKIWTSRRRDKTKFHHPQKQNFVVIL